MKAGCVIGSDLHAHCYKDFASSNKKGYNTRLVHCLSVLEQALRHTAEEGYKQFLFCGDLIHSRTLIDATVILGLSTVFRRWAAEGLEIILVPGNHDLYARGSDRRACLEVFGNIEGVYILDRGVRRTKGGLTVMGLGYGTPFPTPKEVRKEFGVEEGEPAVLIAHDFVSGTKKGDGYMFEEGVSPSRIKELFPFFRGFFFGHVHTQQEVIPDRVYVPGAMLQRYFDDAGERRGFLEVQMEPDRVGVGTIRPKGVPEFIVVDPGHTSHKVWGDVERDFYKFVVNQRSQLEQVATFIKENGIRHFVIDRDLQSEASSKLRLDLKAEELPTLPDKAVLESFIETTKPAQTLNRKELIKLGLGFLKEGSID